ncbi:receptor-like serine/threonine-protein kinase SD1-6 [Salvia divinorum]|uniref:Receptor-like serine/threonine-protein kinase n=1 Tax=Salvia divinorum TaxID=28513 RepID=A0ABD1I4J3_SALDI
MATQTKFMLSSPFFLLFFACNGSDTIVINHPLSPNQTIVSKQDIFEMGFFLPAGSTNYYVGIWYRNKPLQSVWVANRNDPISPSLYNTSLLQLSNGTLTLIVNSLPIWTLPSPSKATQALLLDTGNFILKNASAVVWQSFDHPWGTWLPGAPITSQINLTSWTKPDDPAVGAGSYSLQMESNELLLKKNGSQTVWKSGFWSNGGFPSFPNSNYLYNFSYVSRNGVDFFTYNVYNESVFVRIVLLASGELHHYVWSEARREWFSAAVQPSHPDFCTADAKCGANAVCDVNYAPACRCLEGFAPRVKGDWDLFDFSNGCVREWALQCEKEKTVFSRVMDDLMDLQRLGNQSSGGDLFVRMEQADRPSRKGKKKVVVALAVSIAAAIAAVVVLSFCLWPNLKSKVFGVVHQDLLQLDLHQSSRAVERNREYELPVFSFSSISAATNNFSDANKLGEGGFGPVYKGELLNGQFVAVKRLSRSSGQGLEEFRNETQLIAKLQHKNLVGILGCCTEKDENILVYEYMPNKSLDVFIFESEKKLDWKKRVEIIEGIAQGLLYLHHYSRLRMIHRDLKASNILLDAEMNPKISDFGMARIFGGNESRANTKRIVGTYGYMSPEYAMKGVFSLKSDVYSFGVVMLEIITGKTISGLYDSNRLTLLEYGWNMWKQERGLELVDSISEVPRASSSVALRCINIALLCVQENPDDRPLMSDVVAMLNNDKAAIASPNHPAFTVGTTSAALEIYSVNHLTVSQVDPR